MAEINGRLVSELKVLELRAELEGRELETTGSKAVLIDRLTRALEEERDESEDGLRDKISWERLRLEMQELAAIGYVESVDDYLIAVNQPDHCYSTSLDDNSSSGANNHENQSWLNSLNTNPKNEVNEAERSIANSEASEVESSGPKSHKYARFEAFDDEKRTTRDRRDVEKIEENRPPKWLTELMPRKSPYFPQLGDDLIYFRQGHKLYIEEVRKGKTYNFSKNTKKPIKSLPWCTHPSLPAEVPVRVIDIKFEIRPPTLCTLKVAITDWETGELTGNNINVTYHDMPGVDDFLEDGRIKVCLCLTCLRFRSLINLRGSDSIHSKLNRAWFIGSINSVDPLHTIFPDSSFLCYKVTWENGDVERVSPWDLEVIPDGFGIPETYSKEDGIPASEEDLHSHFYEVNTRDWPPSGKQEVECQRIVALFEHVMGLPKAENFLAPVEYNKYPDYVSKIAYPMDLNAIKTRLENRFYRRVDALKFDIKHIALNAEQFNKPMTEIVKEARIISDLCLQISCQPELTDGTETEVTEIYRTLIRSFKWKKTATHEYHENRRRRSQRMKPVRTLSKRGRHRVRKNYREDVSDSENEESQEMYTKKKSIVEVVSTSTAQAITPDTDTGMTNLAKTSFIDSDRHEDEITAKDSLHPTVSPDTFEESFEVLNHVEDLNAKQKMGETCENEMDCEVTGNYHHPSHTPQTQPGQEDSGSQSTSVSAVSQKSSPVVATADMERKEPTIETLAISISPCSSIPSPLRPPPIKHCTHKRKEHEAKKSSQVSRVFLEVKGMSSSTTETDLKKLFRNRARVFGIKNIDNRQHDRVGILTVANSEEASSCIKKLNSIKFDGYRLTIDFLRKSLLDEVKKSSEKEAEHRSRRDRSGSRSRPQQRRHSSLSREHCGLQGRSSAVDEGKYAEPLEKVLRKSSESNTTRAENSEARSRNKTQSDKKCCNQDKRGEDLSPRSRACDANQSTGHRNRHPRRRSRSRSRSPLELYSQRHSSVNRSGSHQNRTRTRDRSIEHVIALKRRSEIEMENLERERKRIQLEKEVLRKLSRIHKEKFQQRREKERIRKDKLKLEQAELKLERKKAQDPKRYTDCLQAPQRVERVSVERRTQKAHSPRRQISNNEGAWVRGYHHHPGVPGTSLTAAGADADKYRQEQADTTASHGKTPLNQTQPQPHASSTGLPGREIRNFKIKSNTDERALQHFNVPVPSTAIRQQNINSNFQPTHPAGYGSGVGGAPPRPLVPQLWEGQWRARGDVHNSYRATAPANTHVWRAAPNPPNMNMNFRWRSNTGANVGVGNSNGNGGGGCSRNHEYNNYGQHIAYPIPVHMQSRIEAKGNSNGAARGNRNWPQNKQWMRDEDRGNNGNARYFH